LIDQLNYIRKDGDGGVQHDDGDQEEDAHDEDLEGDGLRPCRPTRTEASRTQVRP